MSTHSEIRGTLRLAWLAVILFLCTGDNARPGENPKPPAGNIVQFDAIIELNAPILKSHVVLFARYWVAPTFYRIAVLWAEPHALNLNFPMYPVTMAVDSNEQRFSVSNQVQAKLGQAFRKPVGKREIFRHRLNSYAIGDMRFTETEALASRIYRNDVEALPLWMGDAAQSVDLANSRTAGRAKREAASLNLQMSKDRVDALEIVDANGLLVKSIGYEYTQRQGRDILRRENVLLPERPLLLDYGQRGVTIRVNSTERTYQQLYGLDHEGGRRCSVEYEPPPTSGAAWPMPARVVVQRADNGVVLRSARMFNFIRRTMTADELRQAAQQVGSFSHEELRVRALFAKYTRADPNKMAGQDANTVDHLRAHFEKNAGTSAGEELKRINMLIQLDWLQGCSPVDHFRQYLAALTANGLQQAAFIGGLNVLDTAVGRRQYTIADELLRQWVRHVMTGMDVRTLLTFAQAQMKKGHSWAVARLLEDGESSASWAERRFEARALRCIALHDIDETIHEPTKKTTEVARRQAAWASQSLDLHGLSSVFDADLAAAESLFTGLAKPNSEQKSLRNELAKIEQDMRKALNLPTSNEVMP